MLRRNLQAVALGLGAWLCVCLLAGAGRAQDADLSPEAVDAAIEAGQAYLLSLQNTQRDDPNYGSWVEPGWAADQADTDSGTDESASAASPVWSRYNVGHTALMTYALIESGLHPNNERIRAALDWLLQSQAQAAEKRQAYLKVLARLLKMPGQIGLRSDDYQRLLTMEREAWECTYNVAFRLLALRAAARANPEYLPAVRKDLQHLISGLNGGAYGYVCMDAELLRRKLTKRRTSVDDIRRLPEMFVDQSNSQYGVLGAWVAGEAGLEVPRAYWQAVEEYWQAVQNADGGWGYTAPPRRSIRRESYPAMTAAGIATLLVTHDQLHVEDFAGIGRNEIDAHLSRGMEWFEQNFARTMNPQARFGESGSPTYGLNYYYLYGVERVALACGYRTFGGVDWYRAGAEYILAQQYRSGKWAGSWTGDWVDGWRPGATAYAMLFLIRGKEPVFFARLEHGGDWNNRPRALANLAAYVGNTMCERRGHWQIVRLAEEPAQWHDAPILLVSGARDPQFTPEQLDKLRTYVQQGGMVLSIEEGRGRAFSRAMEAACEAVFPDHPLQPVPPEHPLYNVQYRLKTSPPCRMAANALRPLWVHVDRDLARAWQLGQARARTTEFQFAINLTLLADGEVRHRRRGVQAWPAPVEVGDPTVRIATLLWDGQAYPEPLAMQRFARQIAAREGVAARALAGRDVADLSAEEVDLAVLTGAGELTLSDAQQKALESFIRAGGTLLVHPAGHDDTFMQAARKILVARFGPPERLAVDDPIYAAKGRAVETLGVMPATRRRLGGKLPWLEAIEVDGRSAVLLSRESFTPGLLGWRGRLAEGYDESTAYAILRNILLAACNAQPASASPPADRAAPDIEIITWQQAGEYVGKTVTVEGRVVNVRDVRGRMWLLDFADPSAGQLTVVIEAKHFPAFAKPPAEAYKGRLIRITGEVRSYEGAPEIEAASPTQIKVVDE
jgi:hypothetical protein